MKKLTLGFGLLVSFCCVLDTWASTQITAKVNADRVNLRAKAELESETVTQASEGLILTVRSLRHGF